MSDNNINLSRETTQKQKKTKNRSQHKMAVFEITEYFMGFLLSKLSLFGSISPLGLSFFSATFPMQEMSFGTIATFLGILSMGLGINSLKYIGALSLYLLLMMLYNKDISEKKWISALFSSLSIFSSGMVFVATDGFLLYDTLCLMLESILCFLSFFVFDKAAILLRTIKSRKVLEPVEVLSLIFLFSSLILSVSSIPNFENAGHILSVFLILTISLSCGFQMSTITGVMAGIVMSTHSLLPAQVFCTYTVSALCAGLAHRYGKAAVGLSFIFSNALITLYVNSSSLTIIDIFCTLSAVLIVVLMPKKFFLRIGELTQSHAITSLYKKDDRALEMITQKLCASSESFCELADLFSTMTDKNSKTNELSPGAVFDCTFDDVCRNCNLCTYCWHKNYNQTTSYLAEMFESMSNRGYAIEFDAPCDFRSECIHFDDFLESVNKNYEIQKINISWASKVRESKSLVAEQFKNISSVLNNIKNQLSEGFEYDGYLEKKLEAEFDKKGIAAKNIRVNLMDCYEVLLTVSSDNKNPVSSSLIAATVGAVLKTPVMVAAKKHTENECFFRLRENSNFCVEVGFAKISPDGSTQSGDSHMFLPLENGKYVLCLSDGMGHGKEAASESRITTELIKKLLSLGFDKETALKIINTFLLFKSKKETYATADVCVINLFSGALEFIKSGAATSYIKSGENIIDVNCNSLPAGAVSALSCDCELEYAKDGDFIIMVTDGISDILETENKNYLNEIIKNFKGNSPRELADEIIRKALETAKNTIYDDMTVLVSKITEQL